MRLSICLVIFANWVIEPSLAASGLGSGAISSRHHASVGEIYTNGSTTADCYGTLISRKVVLTTGSCLYDRTLRRQRPKIQFSKNQQKLTSYYIKIYRHWNSTGSQESDVGLLILPSAMSIPIMPLTWSPYAIEDISVVMATASSSRTCSSGNHNHVALGRRDNQTIAVECSGMLQEKPGAAMIHETGTRSEVFGVYTGQCSGGCLRRGSGQKVCGVRLSGAIFKSICKAMRKLGEQLPACADPLLLASSIKRPAVIREQAAYQALARYPPNMTVVLHYCLDSALLRGNYSGCTMCNKKNADNFASLDRLKSFHRRVAVRVVAIGRKLGIPEVKEVPITLVRLPGETYDRVYTGYATGLEHTILSATTAAVRKRRSFDPPPGRRVKRTVSSITLDITRKRPLSAAMSSHTPSCSDVKRRPVEHA